MDRGEFAIIGTGEVPCGNYPERSEFETAYTVARAAIRDAGIDKDEIGAVVCAQHIMSNPNNDYNTEMVFGRLPEAIGAKGCRITCMTSSGGASSFSLRKTVEGILHSGETDTVLVVHAQRFSTFTPNEQAKYFSIAGSDVEWEVPYGMTYNALAAMVTQGYMAYTGTTIEQVASVCVACRKWAMLQPNAMFNKKEITVEKVLSSRMVAYPLTAFMCNVLADGGSAFVMTTAEKAKKVCDRPVYILGDASSYSHRTITRSKSRDLAKMGESMAPVAREAYEKAGLGPEDMDIYQVYGSYPALQLIVMDALGICEPGRSGALVESGETSPGGKYPVTTNGEALSFGHTGTGVGIALLVESVRQLQGKAGKAQVEGARFLVENTGGGAFMDCHFTILGNEIPH
ncbi:MAG: thiolase family protein [Actinobacteria bacterium]|jgi:acetyl-CoA acetyltransferase|nr:MAG: thiolase family protein [Actinomycetota bacterium]